MARTVALQIVLQKIVVWYYRISFVAVHYDKERQASGEGLRKCDIL